MRKMRDSPSEDLFDTYPAIENIEQAIALLTEALKLAKEGTIESLLRYFRVGYMGGTWHLPSIATNHQHGIEHRLAKLLEDELLQGTGFHFRYEKGPQKWYLYYAEPNAAQEEPRNRPGQIGRLVGRVNIWDRRVEVYFSFANEYKKITQLAKERRAEAEKIRQWLGENVSWLRRYEARFWVKWFGKGRVMAMWDVVRQQEKRMRIFLEDAVRMEKEIENIRAIESKMPILNRFEKYGFVIFVISEGSKGEKERRDQRAGR